MTVNTTFASGTWTGPSAAASTYRRPCRTDTENQLCHNVCRFHRRHPGRQQPRGDVEPLGVLHLAYTTTSHDTTILPGMSRPSVTTPQLLQAPVAQRHLKAEVTHCVGGVVSPVLANLFLHYAFDAWMAREFPAVRFERYVDDVVVHAATQAHAGRLRSAIETRMVEVGLQLHPDKTRIVYCKDSNRRGLHEHTSFTFLGYTFCTRSTRSKRGLMFAAFLPAVSRAALIDMGRQVRRWRLHLRVGEKPG